MMLSNASKFLCCDVQSYHTCCFEMDLRVLFSSSFIIFDSKFERGKTKSLCYDLWVNFQSYNTWRFKLISKDFFFLENVEELHINIILRS